MSYLKEGDIVEPIPERDRMGIFNHPRFAQGPFTVKKLLPPVARDEGSSNRVIVEDRNGQVVKNVADDDPAMIADWYLRRVSE